MRTLEPYKLEKKVRERALPHSFLQFLRITSKPKALNFISSDAVLDPDMAAQKTGMNLMDNYLV